MPFDPLGFDPKTPSDLELLKRARALIADPDHWTKRAYIDTVNGFIQRCPIAALADTCGATTYVQLGRRERQLARLLIQAMPANGGLLSKLVTDRRRLILFNDSNDTTHQDVMVLFDRAILSATHHPVGSS